ncbi:DUF2785 domain-containing protein [Leuconostoc sp. JNUCC 76]
MTLKERLLKLKSEPTPFIPNELLFKMIDNIGNLDSELRDELIYSTFAQYVINNKLSLTQEQQVTDFLIMHSLLLKNIDNKDDKQSIFTRSFTALFLAVLSYKHNRVSFLSSQQQRQIIKQSTIYIENEHDLRGLTVHGWAHGIAHVADLIDEIIDFNCFTYDDAIRIMNIVKNILQYPFAFTADEPGRLVMPILHLFRKKIVTEHEICNWLVQLNHLNKNEFNAYSNVSLFLIKLQANMLIAQPQSNKIASLVNKTIKQNYQQFKYI